MAIRGFAERGHRGSDSVGGSASPGSSAGVPRRNPAVRLDESQRTVLRLADGASAAVIGAPGTGKTTTLIELLADRVLTRGYAPERVLALAPTRTNATRLRDDLALRLAVPTNGPLARTATSLAFEIAGFAAAQSGEPPLRLITGGEQDTDMSQLLAGHLDEGTGPVWPPALGAHVRHLRGFRTELRDLLLRSTESGISPQRLREFGWAEGRAEWVAAADFFDEYLDVSGWVRPGQSDSADLGRRAIAAIDAGIISDRVANIRLIVVDDLQEATESTLGLLRSLAAHGVAVVAFGDPDVAANTFRGGEPHALGRFPVVLGLPSAERLLLSTVHRQGSELRTLTSAIVARIGTAAAGAQRAATVLAREPAETFPDQPGPGSSDPESAVRPALIRIEAATPSREWAAIARLFRERHLVDGLGWHRLVVIVRSGDQVPVAARALALADVPTRTAVGGRPLREDHAARDLLGIVDVGVGRTRLTPALASELLLGRFGALDRLSLRRLRLALRAEELAEGGSRSSDDLLVHALLTPGRFVGIDHRFARTAERMTATLAAVKELASAEGTIEELLWLAWERSGLAASWLEQALGAGITAAEANRYLDGIVALFTAAKRFVERQPASPARVFLDAVLDAEVPEDTLSPQVADDAVLVTTPSGAVGLEFDVVAVAGVQDGAWPNLRPRGSLLGAQSLVDLANGVDTGTIDQRRQVLGDELRMFALAVSRARQQVIVSAVATDDEAPSVFFSFLPPDLAATDTSALPPLSLRGLTGRLRRELVHGHRSEAERDAAASALATLAVAGVPGAAVDDWLGLLEPSTDEPLYLDDETVPVSPSQLAAVEKSPLDWFLSSVSGSKSSTDMALGTIIHWAMETADDPTVDGLYGAIESRWHELLFESPWISEYRKVAARRLATGVAEYLADFDRGGSTLVAAEGQFEFDVGRARVRGSIDRVERAADGSVVIVDLKTGRPVTKQAEIDEHPQLRAYQLAYAEGHLDNLLEEFGAHHAGGAKLLFVKDGLKSKSYRQAEQPRLGEDELDGFRQRIRQAAALMAATGFVGSVEVPLRGAVPDIAAALHRVRAVTSD